jgi:pyrroloquinoline quinone biosynthesis protein B
VTVEVRLLGTAQDGGVPQAGCLCRHCQEGWLEPDKRQLVVCLGLVDTESNQSWLIEATPDFREQLHLLQYWVPGCPLVGILLTHAHIGHYTGLIHLGQEAMNSQALPLYTTHLVANFLRENAPWSQLISRQNVQLQLLTPGKERLLSPNLGVTPISVPYRDEWGDTMAFVVRGPDRRLFFCPDIDSWQAWALDARQVVAGMDVALLDGCFFSSDELPGRDLRQIPHPLVTDTVARLSGLTCEINLIHLNHSNPLLHEGTERAWLARQGFGVGYLGQTWRL